MSHRKFNFRQSQELLHVDPKTFGRWLAKAHIDPDAQRDKFDPRQKFLTEDQLYQLAAAHDRELPPLNLDSPSEETTALPLTTLTERLIALEQQMIQRFDQFETRVQASIADLRHDLASLEQRITTPLSNQTEAKQPPAPTASPASAPVRKSPKTTKSTKKPTKKTTRGKRLPRDFVPLHTLAHEHGISEGAADHAAQTRKIPIVRGRWLYKSRYVTSVLDRQGQHEFYTLFHERAEFQACQRCPHAPEE